jgi:DNA polymerase
MNNTACSAMLAAYFRQQAELGVPPHIFSDSFNRSALVPTAATATVRHQKVPPVVRNLPAPKRSRPGALPESNQPLTRGRVPLQADRLMAHTAESESSGSTTPLTGKRALLAEFMYRVRACQQCPLGGIRNNFVFGSGNAEAKVMVIGEAPGEEEDLRGLPFVGAAGKLLTKMLAAINLDRKLHVFISNVIKCRPPHNRTPDSSEILACMPVITRQIEIIEPKAILLLGKVAAHALLDRADSIACLRSETHSYHGIPTFVTYHPAALLRNPDYRKPAWEDLQKLQRFLNETGAYDNAAINE